MKPLRDSKTGRFISIKQRTRDRLMVENAARAFGHTLQGWRDDGKLVVRVKAASEPRP